MVAADSKDQATRSFLIKKMHIASGKFKTITQIGLIRTAISGFLYSKSLQDEGWH